MNISSNIMLMNSKHMNLNQNPMLLNPTLSLIPQYYYKLNFLST